MEPLAYSPALAAKQLGISRAKLYQLIGAKKIRIVKIGSRTLVPADELVAFLERNLVA